MYVCLYPLRQIDTSIYICFKLRKHKNESDIMMCEKYRDFTNFTISCLNVIPHSVLSNTWAKVL